MSLELRITYVKPGMPTKVWDAKMVDGRKDVRVFPNGQQGDSSEFIEINVLNNTDSLLMPQMLLPRRLGGQPVIATKKPSKSQRKKIARRKIHERKKS